MVRGGEARPASPTAARGPAAGAPAAGEAGGEGAAPSAAASSPASARWAPPGRCRLARPGPPLPCPAARSFAPPRPPPAPAGWPYPRTSRPLRRVLASLPFSARPLCQPAVLSPGRARCGFPARLLLSPSSPGSSGTPPGEAAPGASQGSAPSRSLHRSPRWVCASKVRGNLRLRWPLFLSLMRFPCCLSALLVVALDGCTAWCFLPTHLQLPTFTSSCPLPGQASCKALLGLSVPLLHCCSFLSATSSSWLPGDFGGPLQFILRMGTILFLSY